MQQVGLDLLHALARQWRQPQRLDPVAQHPCPAFARQGFQRARVEPVGAGAEHAGQGLRILRMQQGRCFGAQRGAAGKAGTRLRPAPRQQRQHLAAQEIPIQRGVVVRRILDPPEPMALRMVQQLLSRHRQQRSPQPARGVRPPRLHRAKPVRTGAAQCAQQEGFGLVVLVVGQGEDFPGAQFRRECGMAGGAGRAFQAQALVARHLDPRDDQRHGQRVAGCLATRGPIVRGRVEPVVHVDGAQRQRGRPLRCQQVQQHHRIQTAAQAEQHAGGAAGRRRGQRGKRQRDIGQAAMVARCGPGCRAAPPGRVTASGCGCRRPSRRPGCTRTPGSRRR